MDIDLRSIVEGIERTCKIILSRKIIETYLDPRAEILHIRFSKPRRVESGETLPPKTLITLFRDEDTNEVTAIEILKPEELLNELNLRF